MHCVVLITFGRERKEEKLVQEDSQGHVSHYHELLISNRILFYNLCEIEYPASGTLATALRRRPFSAYNKGNRRRLHAAKTDRKLCVFMQRSCDLLQKWSIFV